MALKLNAKMVAFIFNNGVEGEGLLQSPNFNKCSNIDFTKRKASISRKSTSPKVGRAVSLWILCNHLPPLNSLTAMGAHGRPLLLFNKLL